MSCVSLVPSRPRRFRMWRHLSSLSGKFAEDQASSGNSDSANWPGYEAGRVFFFLPFYPIIAEPGPRLKPPPVALPRATTHEGHESPSCVQRLFLRNNSDQATYPDNMKINKPLFIIYNDDLSTCPSLQKGNLFPRQQKKKKRKKKKNKKDRKTEKRGGFNTRSSSVVALVSSTFLALVNKQKNI